MRDEPVRFDTPPPPWVDDVSAPVKERVRSYEQYMATVFEPYDAARRAYEEATGVFLDDSAIPPDGPFDPDTV